MKRLLTVFFALSFAFLITSCATTYPNQKLLIGAWRTVKVEKSNIPATLGKTDPTPLRTTPVTAPHSDSVAPAREASKAEQQLARLIQSESRATLTINADKTAVKEYPGKTIHGTWKFKNNTHLQVVSKETDKKMIFEIQKINDTLAIVKEPLPVGELKITYKKIKK